MAVETIDVVAAPPGPTPINAQPQPPALDESAVRAAVMKAEAEGKEVADITAQTSGLDRIVPVISPTASQTQTPQDIPAKFVNPDGTVDVQKITDSTKQLDAGIEKKQLTIEEALAQYKERERQFRTMPSSPEQVQRYVQQQAQAQPPAPVQPAYQPPAPAQLPPDQLQAQLIQEYQRDPIGTMADLTKVLIAQQQKPVMDFIERLREQERDNGVRNNLQTLAQEDPRVLHPLVYAEIVKEMDNDPGYRHLKNPHKAAWNEVKGRLRLGDVQTPAQPSRTATPILGGGTPPPVPSSASGTPTPQNLLQAIGQMKSPDEQARVEAEIRRLMVSSGM
jgi:hypothetical protein